MRCERTREEVLKDKALLLAYLSRIHDTNSGRIGNRLKMQKLTFLLCYRLFARRLKGLDYVFFTYRWGPFTKDLYEAEADFEEAGLLERDGKNYRLTEAGAALGNDIYESLRENTDNQPILEILDGVVDEFATWPTQELVDHAHQMQVMPVGWHEREVLEDLPLHIDLTRILDDEEAVAILEIDQGWLDSFGAALTPRVADPIAGTRW